MSRLAALSVLSFPGPLTLLCCTVLCSLNACGSDSSDGPSKEGKPEALSEGDLDGPDSANTDLPMGIGGAQASNLSPGFGGGVGQLEPCELPTLDRQIELAEDFLREYEVPFYWIDGASRGADCSVDPEALEATTLRVALTLDEDFDASPPGACQSAGIVYEGDMVPVIATVSTDDEAVNWSGHAWLIFEDGETILRLNSSVEKSPFGEPAGTQDASCLYPDVVITAEGMLEAGALCHRVEGKGSFPTPTSTLRPIAVNEPLPKTKVSLEEALTKISGLQLTDSEALAWPKLNLDFTAGPDPVCYDKSADPDLAIEFKPTMTFTFDSSVASSTPDARMSLPWKAGASNNPGFIEVIGCTEFDDLAVVEQQVENCVQAPDSCLDAKAASAAMDLGIKGGKFCVNMHLWLDLKAYSYEVDGIVTSGNDKDNMLWRYQDSVGTPPNIE